MSMVPTITHDGYPRQYRENIGARILATFHYDVNHPLPGTVVRDDAEEPHRTVILMDDGRTVLGSECVWRMMEEAEKDGYPVPGRVEANRGPDWDPRD